jgi:hypothetical protein
MTMLRMFCFLCFLVASCFFCSALYQKKKSDFLWKQAYTQKRQIKSTTPKFPQTLHTATTKLKKKKKKYTFNHVISKKKSFLLLIFCVWLPRKSWEWGRNYKIPLTKTLKFPNTNYQYPVTHNELHYNNHQQRWKRQVLGHKVSLQVPQNRPICTGCQIWLLTFTSAFNTSTTTAASSISSPFMFLHLFTRNLLISALSLS